MSETHTFDASALAAIRRAFAMQMLAMNGIAHDPPLLEAFARVPRERFLGPSPWQMVLPSGLVPVPAAEPALACADVLFALAPERGVNNGSPSLHARWLHRAGLRAGERVVHLGAGTGYYTALIAELVGLAGRVTAVECDPRLAADARAALAPWPNVTVVEGDAAAWPQNATDCVYVNFSVERPAPTWLDNLVDGGRLLFPLGVPPADSGSRPWRHAERGRGLLIERASADRFSAASLGPAFFVCAEGGGGALTGSDAEREALRAAFVNGGAEFIRSLRWRQAADPLRSWYAAADWSLSYDEAD